MRFCLMPNCGAKVERGYCQAHTRQRNQARGSQRNRGYTRRWEAAAARFKAAYPLCGQRPGGQRPVLSRCFDDGIVTPATQVDHVVPHRGDLVLFWDQNNWQSLCASCGSAKTFAGL